MSTHADHSVSRRVQADVTLQHSFVVFVVVSAGVAARGRRRRARLRLARLGHHSARQNTLSLPTLRQYHSSTSYRNQSKVTSHYDTPLFKSFGILMVSLSHCDSLLEKSPVTEKFKRISSLFSQKLNKINKSHPQSRVMICHFYT